MPLQHQSTEEARYDAETLRKVTALAERLQRERQETLTAREMELIGAEVGLEAPFIRQALEHVTAPTRTTRAPAPNTAMHKAIAAAWWAGGWTLPLVLLMLGSSTNAGKPGGLIGFFLGWGVYIAAGVILSGLVREAPATVSDDNTPHSRAEVLHALSSLPGVREGQFSQRTVLSVAIAGQETLAAEPEAEHSFGQLWGWIDEITRAYGGELLEPAGGGVVCVFPQEAAALRAARALQTGIPRFNVERNRLSQPFRLRCGLSAGELGQGPAGSPGLQHPLVSRAVHHQKVAAPGDIVVGAELAATGLIELGGLAPVSESGAEPRFSWQAAQRRTGG